ncbi:MAG: hypothetical protein A2741_00065 [Candidatus Zambryskibacteria bacterium RIFCSPHIGHO2_01_FULL_43_27]|uniref:BIG2 domain-containing protein n=1 Tax=Candidatus Zambryskibacteria bacterium RIFCSPLOWO2_01_FULL_43_17 TaxID=1802760 RepID=A0A1G2U5K7_9BACT|nr:MAG: hypothetical protein A2741_00065 [Candidatus Zambryskibacteria bacterium RIFCSPHIGHO2_01_FULL_43_27]OHA99480.1 MAG: hypothetical protein A3E93_02790 [Candidatus Zambryskibacteria bacterium RIFCSPHIGHO2_12_FULL_43_12b]OHB04778.1 MAG: hypothetical protein A2920_00725 [Candidatus Zambryskibacteria bacterium RIFCSPLOWO2_01_FULL_43_17]
MRIFALGAKRAIRIAAALALFIAASCEENNYYITNPPPDDGGGSVVNPTTSLTPENDTILVAESLDLVARLTPQVAGSTVSFTTTSPARATVDENGKVTGVAPGTARIIATFTFGAPVRTLVDTALVTVWSWGISISPTVDTIQVGEKMTPTVKVTVASGYTSAFRCSSSNAAVATVNPNTCEVTGIYVNPPATSATVNIEALMMAVHPTQGGKKASMRIVVLK